MYIINFPCCNLLVQHLLLGELSWQMVSSINQSQGNLTHNGRGGKLQANIEIGIVIWGTDAEALLVALGDGMKAFKYLKNDRIIHVFCLR